VRLPRNIDPPKRIVDVWIVGVMEYWSSETPTLQYSITPFFSSEVWKNSGYKKNSWVNFKKILIKERTLKGRNGYEKEKPKTPKRGPGDFCYS
jgi:hypothetical protein